MEAVNGSEKRWVQEKLLWVFERTFEHHWQLFSADEFEKIVKGIEKLDGGKEWIRASGRLWGRQDYHLGVGPDYSTNLVELLEGYGVKVESKEAEK